jgi:hypothetical protein
MKMDLQTRQTRLEYYRRLFISYLPTVNKLGRESPSK